MNKATKGPWEVRLPRRSKRYTILGPKGERICETGIWKGYQPAEIQANAHLIKAAPNIYAVLERIDRSWTEDIPDGPDFKGSVVKIADEHVQIWREIRTVLSEAQGDGQPFFPKHREMVNHDLSLPHTRPCLGAYCAGACVAASSVRRLRT